MAKDKDAPLNTKEALAWIDELNTGIRDSPETRGKILMCRLCGKNIGSMVGMSIGKLCDHYEKVHNVIDHHGLEWITDIDNGYRVISEEDLTSTK